MRENECRLKNCDECPHKNRTHLYLSHPVSLRTMIRKFELYIEKNSRLELFNPFYDADRKEIKAMDAGKDISEIYRKLNPTKIVEDDINYINHCDGIVSFLGDGDAKSFGTICEVWYAYERGIPIFIITHFLQEHPWVKYVTKKTGGKIFRCWSDFMKYAIAGKIKLTTEYEYS